MMYLRELQQLMEQAIEGEEDQERKARGLEPVCHHRWPNGAKAIKHHGYDRGGNGHATCLICGEPFEQ